MAAPRIAIDALPTAPTVPVGGLLIIQDAGTTRKMDVALVAQGSGLDAHLTDGDDAHDASAISAQAGVSLTGINVQAQLTQADQQLGSAGAALLNHLNDTVDAHDASAISVTPFGTIAGTTVQTVLQEIVTETPKYLVLATGTPIPGGTPAGTLVVFT